MHQRLDRSKGVQCTGDKVVTHDWQHSLYCSHVVTIVQASGQFRRVDYACDGGGHRKYFYEAVQFQSVGHPHLPGKSSWLCGCIFICLLAHISCVVCCCLQMQCTWLGERVATANVAKVIENVLR